MNVMYHCGFITVRTRMNLSPVDRPDIIPEAMRAKQDTSTIT